MSVHGGGEVQRAGSTSRPGGRRNALRYRIGLLLLALAVLPLSGAAWFAIGEVATAQAARAQAAQVDSSVTRLVLLTELKARLLDERNWTSASNSMTDFGLDEDLVLQLTGLDISSEATSAGQRVDELVDTIGLESLAEALAEARAPRSEDVTIRARRYDEIEVEVDLLSTEVLDELLAMAGRIDGAERLVTALRVLQAATEARQASSRQFTAFFGVQFASISPATSNTAELLGQESIRDQAVAEIRRVAEPTSRSHQAIETIVNSPEVGRFDEAVAGLVAQTIESDAGADPSGTSLMLDIDSLAGLFTAGSATTEVYLELVSAAGVDVLGASDDLQRAADDQLDGATISIVGLAAASLLFAGVATRSIARPMRRLAEVARQVSDGQSSARFGTAGGATEIRDAAQAMDAAAAHLQLAEQQATALAEGDLDNPILSQVSTGQLGASLQSAVQALASSMQDREEFRRRMTHEATHDGLTQIANRNASLAQLRRGLARVLRSESSLAVFFVDLDGFKDVNDRHGHQAGDTVLRTSAQRLVNNIREGDHVGRLGGDEFLIIAEPIEGAEDALAIARRLLELLSEPIQIENATVMVRASIGIAISDGGPVDSTDLLRDADLAVYKAKAQGRNRIEVCDDELRAAMHRRAEIERDLRRAIGDNELTLVYQPIVSSADRRLVEGYEALVRWNRPGQGLVPPDDFIPVAERSDLILSIDRWVVDAAVRQIRAWDDGGIHRDVRISVNVSGRHLNSASLVDDVLSPLRDHRVEPSRLVVEITESALLEDLEGAAIKLQMLRQKGIRTAIDDFGTGYTSLAHLKSLPIDILKIDRSFVNDSSATSLVQLIIDTGHLLGASITAEGIETPEQADRLTGMGADVLQGYLYGKPRPPDDLVTTIDPDTTTSTSGTAPRDTV